MNWYKGINICILGITIQYFSYLKTLGLGHVSAYRISKEGVDIFMIKIDGLL